MIGLHNIFPRLPCAVKTSLTNRFLKIHSEVIKTSFEWFSKFSKRKIFHFPEGCKGANFSIE